MVVVYQLVDTPGWTHGSQVQAIVGRRKLWVATLVNAVFPGVAVAFAVYYWSRPKPGFVANYWVISCAITLASAIAMWYVPYFRGPARNRSATTRGWMPARNTFCRRAATTRVPTGCMFACMSCS